MRLREVVVQRLVGWEKGGVRELGFAGQRVVIHTAEIFHVWREIGHRFGRDKAGWAESDGDGFQLEKGRHERFVGVTEVGSALVVVGEEDVRGDDDGFYRLASP